MCFFCFTTDLNYDPQKNGYDLRASLISNWVRNSALICMTVLLRAARLEHFRFRRSRIRTFRCAAHIGSRVPTNREG